MGVVCIFHTTTYHFKNRTKELLVTCDEIVSSLSLFSPNFVHAIFQTLFDRSQEFFKKYLDITCIYFVLKVVYDITPGSYLMQVQRLTLSIPALTIDMSNC